MRHLVPIGIAATLFATACHKKQKAVAPPIPSPTQPRTVGPKQTGRRKPAPSKKQSTMTATATEAPKLVDFLTETERQQYEREIIDDLHAAEENVAAFRRTGVSGSEKEIERVDSLIRRSRQERQAGDLTTARKLASMAKIVSETLR